MLQEPATVMIVDDNPANLGPIVEYLEAHHYRTVVAQGGNEALQRAAIVRPDLILMDVLMPDMSGIDACRQLKGQPETTDIPVLLMTALGDTQHKLAGFEAGAVDYLTKPLQIEEVAARVETNLKLRAMQKRLEAKNAELQRYRDELELRVEERTAELREEIASRQQAELRLLNQGLRLQTLIQTIPDPVWLKDTNGVYLACNAAICRLFGASEAEILGKTDWDFVDAELAEFVRQKDKETIQAGRPCINEEWVTHPVNGRQILYETIKTPLYDANGEVVGVLGVARDITEHKLLENELRIKDHYQRALLDNFPFIVWLKDTQSRFLAVNEPLAKAAGVASGTMMHGKTDLDFFPRDLAESYRADDLEVLRTGIKKAVEEHISDQGVRRWYETYKAPVVVDGRLLGTVGFARDISEHKQLQENLAAREREFRTLSENLPDILIRYDTECHVLYYNQAVQKSVHASFMIRLGVASEGSVRVEWGGGLYELLQRVIETGQRGETEAIVLDPAGTLQTYLFSIVAEHDEVGTVIGALAIGRNINSIKESERQLRMLVENIPDCIMRMDPDGRFLYVSQATMRAFNLPQERFIGKTAVEVGLAGDPEGDRQILDAALKAGREGMHEMLTMTVASPDGERVFDMLYVPERDEFGNVISILGMARDITSLQLAHHELQMKEALLRSLIDSIPDLIFFKDLESRYLGFNKAFAEYCARSEAQMVGKTDYDFAPRAVAEFYRKKDKEMLASGRSRNNDEWITYPNGRSVLLDTRKTPLLGANGEVLGIIGVSRDITERRHMEEALRRREQEFRTLAEHSPDMIARYDRSCNHIYVNPAYARNTGMFVSKARGASLETIWKRLLPCLEFRERLEQVIATGRGDQILLEWMRPGGQVTSHRMQMIAEYDESGEVSGALVIGHDITELKATERRLEKSRAQLRGMTRRREDAREEERTRIAREIHDELGQLLSVLRLNVTTLDYRFGEDNAELRLKTQKMVGTVDSAINVVRNLAAKLRPAALSAGIASALEWLVQEFGDNTELECLLHLPEREVQLDEERATAVFRIAQESLTNIMRHASARRAIISLRCQDEACELEISDDGNGFDPAQVAGQNSFGIIGMRERALMLGGVLHIDSSIGGGTVLKLHLPIDGGVAEPVDSA